MSSVIKENNNMMSNHYNLLINYRYIVHLIWFFVCSYLFFFFWMLDFSSYYFFFLKVMISLKCSFICNYYLLVDKIYLPFKNVNLNVWNYLSLNMSLVKLRQFLSWVVKFNQQLFYRFHSYLTINFFIQLPK